MRAGLLPLALAEVEARACAAYPHEACGVLLGRAGDPARILEAHACANAVTERARDRYLIDPLDQLRIEKDARARSLDVVGYYHSHPDHPAQASATDLEQSWERLLYLIVSVRAGRVEERRAWFRAPGRSSFEEVLLDREV
ncbi:MAG TPA: M67 family metallopeptidase [bacterium]|nr:M67 family metallopeptidase [bacterium]